ncbi:hypothetical protein V5F77_09225 [Xanthobacter sp. DSM 24535]|uniref:hypothetical protein n=1 Tax=Roseixanthobacter psychrophilus TaxID=3119917 RepID=UPI0037290188
MPPFLIVLLGAAGAVAATRFLVREGRRVSRTMDAHRAASGVEGSGVEGAGAGPQEKVEVLERDPVTGTYRPRRR